MVGVTRLEQIRAGVDNVRAAIDAAAQRAGRSGSEVTLVAVTKTWPISDIEHVAACGIVDVGENRHQDAKEKSAALEDQALRWHFLGQLQSNKARAVGAYATVVHSVDRLELLGALGRGALAAGRTVEVLLQLSLDGDTSRGGCIAAELPSLAEAAAATDGLHLAGLMVVAPVTWEPRAAFEQARAAHDALVQAHPGARTLSAGMSGDFEAAVEAGATMVRVGSAIFGGRTPAVG